MNISEERTKRKAKRELSYKIFEILKWDNRSNWFNQIIPYIKEVDKEKRVTYLKDDSFYAFLPEELKMDYPWKFKIRDIVTNGKDIMMIWQLPEAHPDNTNYNFARLTFNADTYWVIRLDEEGNDLDINNSLFYLHTYFNEDQIWKVDPDVERKYKEITSNKKYWFEEAK